MNERARGQQGSDWPGPHFPRYGEHWDECYICGADYPHSKMTRHYKNHRLVCRWCDDEKTNSDFLQDMETPREIPDPSEQPVTCQGEGTRPDEWYTGLWYDMEWYGEEDPCEV
jgi:hypothetical protein